MEINEQTKDIIERTLAKIQDSLSKNAQWGTVQNHLSNLLVSIPINKIRKLIQAA